jgi:hypothetical protein
MEVLRPYGVIETVRTGRVAMARGSAASSLAGLQEIATAEEGLSYSV